MFKLLTALLLLSTLGFSETKKRNKETKPANVKQEIEVKKPLEIEFLANLAGMENFQQFGFGAAYNYDLSKVSKIKNFGVEANAIVSFVTTTGFNTTLFQTSALATYTYAFKETMDVVAKLGLFLANTSTAYSTLSSSSTQFDFQYGLAYHYLLDNHHKIGLNFYRTFYGVSYSVQF